MEIMTVRRIRHLPVGGRDRLDGRHDLGSATRARRDREQQEPIEQLEKFIAG